MQQLRNYLDGSSSNTGGGSVYNQGSALGCSLGMPSQQEGGTVHSSICRTRCRGGAFPLYFGGDGGASGNYDTSTQPLALGERNNPLTTTTPPRRQ